MARNIDSSRGIDPENAAALSGAPRGRRNIREDDLRETRRARRRRDKFYVPPEAIPSGYVVEWKRKSCLGKQEEADYVMDLAEGGWKYADPRQFHMLVPPDYEGKTVERGGQVLMIRPSHLKKAALRLDKEEALGQVRDKLMEIGMTAEGEAPRRVQGLNREWDRPAGRNIPDDDGEESMHEGTDNRPGEA